MRKNTFRTIIVFVTLLGAALPASAEQVDNGRGPRLLILKFTNSSGDENYNYLESSITESVTQYLRERYVFQQMVASQRDEYIRENFYNPEDFHTETVSMKLGLELNQDAVISGNFWVKANEIITHVRITDIRNRKSISQFQMKGPAGSNLFISVEKIAVRIATESSSILPNKEEYAKKGTAAYISGPFFSRVSVGARVGGQYYFGGYNDYLKADQPSFGLGLRMFSPYFRQRLGLQADLTVMSHSLNDKRATFLTEAGVQMRTTNFIPGLGFVFEISLSQKWSLSPILGGGFALQASTLSGNASQSLVNGLPFAYGGLDASFALNRMLDFVIAPRLFSMFESGKVSHIANLSAGVNFKF